MLVSLSHGEKLDISENILLGGYTEDKSQMVLVKIFGELVDSDQKVIHCTIQKKNSNLNFPLF